VASKKGENVMRATSRLLSTAVVAVGMTALLVGAGLAQNATPTASPGTRATPSAKSQADLGPFASHLDSGSCGNLGAEVARLADLQLPSWVGAMSGGTAMGAGTPAASQQSLGNAPIPVAVSTTSVNMAIGDIVAGKHAITVEQGSGGANAAVVCGDIGGVPDDNGDLFVGLDQVNSSGHFGIAWLHGTGATTTVVVFLAHPEEKARLQAAMTAMATPVAAPKATPMATAKASPAAKATPMASPKASPTT
jgi:hypothetical protein